jgi:hypothetical protein
MHLTIFSGASIPATNAQRRKKRHGRRSCKDIKSNPRARISADIRHGELTFNQTTIKLQKPIIPISLGESPAQAFVSLIATTYMKCWMNSIVSKQIRNRIKYPMMARREMFSGDRIYVGYSMTENGEHSRY